MALAVDFPKAFGIVNPDALLNIIHLATLNNNVVKWISPYPLTREVDELPVDSVILCLSFEHSFMECLRALLSLPNPHLYNFCVLDYPQSADLTTSYAEDFTAAKLSSSLPVTSQRLSAHAEDVAAWAEDKGLSIMVEKSHPTLFTSDIRQSYLDPEGTLNGA